MTNEFLDGGADVVISGIDTTEAIVRAGQAVEAGEDVWAVPFDYRGACDEAPDACLGVPYFNWGPSYLEKTQSVIDGTFVADLAVARTGLEDINNPDTSAVGWLNGPALTDEAATMLDEFIAGLASGEINLFTGPLNYQDGTRVPRRRRGGDRPPDLVHDPAPRGHRGRLRRRGVRSTERAHRPMGVFLTIRS